MKELDKVLEVRNLHASFTHKEEVSKVLNGIDLSIKKGEILGLLGESGAGKSFLGRCIMGLLPEGLAKVDQGSITYFSKDKGEIELLSLNPSSRARIMGKNLTLMFQETNASLNPSLRIFNQIQKGYSGYQSSGSKLKSGDILSTLRKLNFEDPERVLASYPHQLSGGMVQRANLAIALVNDPDLLILDESTSSLDKETEEIIIEALKLQVEEKGTSILFISHDHGLVEQLCSRKVFLKEGKISFDEPERSATKVYSKPTLKKDPIGEPWLKVYELSKSFPDPSRGIFEKKRAVPVLKEINFEASNSQSIGVTGRSGSGKSTLAKLILGLYTGDQGSIELFSEPIKESMPKAFRKDHQIVFQDVNLSMNPLKSVSYHLYEPLKIHGIKGQKEKVSEILELFNLEEKLLDRYPHQLSVGQRQRVLFARSLVMRPRMLILDEAFSSLDPANRADLSRLILKQKEENNLNFLMISHDEDHISELCDNYIHLVEGRIEEEIIA